jgi:hypothetical protein
MVSRNRVRYEVGEDVSATPEDIVLVEASTALSIMVSDR